jgi:hypothetical protein
MPANKLSLDGVADGDGFTRDEVAVLYHAIFYVVNDEQPLPAGHPPTHAQTAAIKLAEALEEDVPDAHLQNFERQLRSAQQRATARIQQQQEHAAALQRQREAASQSGEATE